MRGHWAALHGLKKHTVKFFWFFLSWSWVESELRVSWVFFWFFLIFFLRFWWILGVEMGVKMRWKWGVIEMLFWDVMLMRFCIDFWMIFWHILELARARMCCKIHINFNIFYFLLICHFDDLLIVFWSIFEWFWGRKWAQNR